MHRWSLPPASGAYALALRLEHGIQLQVGKLGTAFFPAGVYFYLGSAHGPGGIRARLGRHLQGGVRLRWHVDYLRAVAVPAAWAITTDPAPGLPWECTWSQRLAALPEAWIPLPGFGASDCRYGCPAHLIGLPLEAPWPVLAEAALGVPLRLI